MPKSAQDIAQQLSTGHIIMAMQIREIEEAISASHGTKQFEFSLKGGFSCHQPPLYISPTHFPEFRRKLVAKGYTFTWYKTPKWHGRGHNLTVTVKAPATFKP